MDLISIFKLRQQIVSLPYPANLTSKWATIFGKQPTTRRAGKHSLFQVNAHRGAAPLPAGKSRALLRDSSQFGLISADTLTQLGTNRALQLGNMLVGLRCSERSRASGWLVYY